MIDKLELKVKKIKRSWCICAGVSILGKFKTETIANEELKKGYKFYDYWANSASVISENTPPTIKVIG